MSAQIIQLDTRRPQSRPAFLSRHQLCAQQLPNTFKDPATPRKVPAARFEFWTGASGNRYVHTTYPFLTCPALPAGNYILVHRSTDGRCKPLAVGRTSNQAQSLNLAEIRRLGASLGANEVHVHLLADDTKKAESIEYDLHAGCFGPLRWSTACH